MSVRIQLDNPREYYTNLDWISGNVILSCQHEETVTAVTVKLEGESYSQLLKPLPNYEAYGDYKRNARDRDRMCRENHKILYKLAQVFPKVGDSTNSLDNAMLGKGMNYTLPPGRHVWPFRFRLPVDNGCASMEMLGVGASYSFGGLRLSDLPGQMAYRHVTKTLPPSLTGFPSEAEIRYFMKVTVQRPGIWRENFRFQVPFRFVPMEPKRPSITGQETYARRAHTFTKAPALHTIKRKPSLFSKETPQSLLSNTPPSISVDARLPNPAILTCRKPIPLRLLVKKQTDSPEIVFLTNLQVELLCYTDIRAQEVERTEQGAWIILTKANLRIPISKPDDQVGDEMVVDGSGLWDVLPIPPGVLPSFQTCNISRHYQLEVKVGLGYGAEGVSGPAQPQSIVQLPLRFPVQVYSGIPTPNELLNGSKPHIQDVPLGRPELRPFLPPRPGTSVSTGVTTNQGYDPAYPPQLRPNEMSDAPPPSYEDAIAEGISSVSIQPSASSSTTGLNNENLGNGASGHGTPTATASPLEMKGTTFAGGVDSKS